MVDSNLDLLSPDQIESDTPSGANKITADVAAQNVAFLRTQAESWLAVLFNVFGSMGRDGRGMVGDVISAWAAIAEEAVRLTRLSIFSLGLLMHLP
jgi:ribosomal RNA-processing protein 12